VIGTHQSWLIIALVALIAGCGRSPHPAQVASAEFGASQILPPVRIMAASPLDWLEATKEEIYSSVDAVNGYPQYLPDDDDLTRRAQFWLGALDGRLRQIYPQFFTAPDGQSIVPKPHIRLMIKAGANAFTSVATACYRVPIRFAAPPAGAPVGDGSSVILINAKGTVGLFPRARVSCINRDAAVQSAELVVRHLLQTLQVKSCSLSVDEGTVIIGSDCHLGASVNATTADGIVLQPVSNWMTLQSSLFDLLPSDGQLAYTILHEAAHYYRTHGAIDKRQYHYFYRINTDNLALSQPSVDMSLDDLGHQVTALPNYRTQPLVGQKWHSELFSYGRLARRSLVQDACGDPTSPCAASCRPWMDIMDDPNFDHEFGRFPQQMLSGDARGRYDRWEATLSQCLTSMTIDDMAHPGSVTPAAARTVFWRAAPLAADGTPFRTVFAIALSMNEQLFALAAAEERLLLQALDQRLGFYTTEEEADNLAQSWLPLLGFAPQNAVDHWLTFAKFKNGREQQGALNFSAEECLLLYRSMPKWSRSGQMVPVPVGSYTAFHHSSCFRIWNADQRLPWVSTPVAESLMPAAEQLGGSFETLRLRARQGLVPIN